jgi:hypothetical protein
MVCGEAKAKAKPTSTRRWQCLRCDVWNPPGHGQCLGCDTGRAEGDRHGGIPPTDIPPTTI